MVTEEVSLVIENPTEGKFLKHIDWNKEEFMALVASITESYVDVVYSEEQIKDAKADRAKLNAMKKAISDRRIQVKKEVMAPYDQFEAEVKEVVALIEEPIAMIDSQIKAYEEKCKEDKRQELIAHFETVAGDMDGILTFDMVFDQRYLNATVSLSKAKLDITDKVDKVRTDLATIEAMDDDVRLVAKNAYAKSLDMSKVMAEVTRIQEMKRREAEEKAKREAEAKAKAEAEAQKVEEVAPKAENATENPENGTENAETGTEIVENETKSAEVERQQTERERASQEVAQDPFAKKQEEDTKIYKASFTVTGTKAQIMSLKQYMIDNNIKFGKVEK